MQLPLDTKLITLETTIAEHGMDSLALLRGELERQISEYLQRLAEHHPAHTLVPRIVSVSHAFTPGQSASLVASVEVYQR